MKSAGLLLTCLLTADSLHAAVYTWTNNAGDNDWVNAANWNVEGSPARSVPRDGDEALFDTSSSDWTVDYSTNISTKAFVRLTGSGTVNFTSSANGNSGRINLGGGLSAEGSVSVNLRGSARLYPSNARTTVWNSSGTLYIEPKDYSLFFNTPNTTFRIKQGTVNIPGDQPFNQTNGVIDLQGGTMKTTSLFLRIQNNDSSAINMDGGDLTQSGDMHWKAKSDINLDDGVFTVIGDITFGAEAGELKFSRGSNGTFVSNNTQSELQAHIDNGDITKSGGTFVFTENGGTTKLSIAAVSAASEPPSTALIGIGKLSIFLRSSK